MLTWAEWVLKVQGLDMIGGQGGGSVFPYSNIDQNTHLHCSLGQEHGLPGCGACDCKRGRVKRNAYDTH